MLKTRRARNCMSFSYCVSCPASAGTTRSVTHAVLVLSFGVVSGSASHRGASGMNCDYTYFYTSIQRLDDDPGWRMAMPHDELLSETRRGRRIRDRGRVRTMLRRRHAQIRSQFHDIPTRAGSGATLCGREADEWYARHFYSARKQCRGICCADWRRCWNAMSEQERRAYDDAREQFDELGLRCKPSRFSTSA